MKLALLRSTALAFALTAGTGLAFAQSGSLSLTDAQKSAIHAALSAPATSEQREATQPAPTAGENFRVGATLAENQLLDIPQQTAAQVPSVQGYKYSVMGDEVALVEPESRRIVTILR